ncbi:hypothetical protein [Sulfuriferula thiophila]|uniref:hypothetical protein n=1 Tax=Sulfuriferula thiophila TaxID=1781211 RepID=UPI000F604BDF|nr:hypothetical protein [Sulfuriferula thiophila]
MPIRRRTLLASAIATTLIGLAAYAFANPGVAACAIIGTEPFVPLLDGTLVESGSSAQDNAAVLQLLSLARTRIQNTFGVPRAKPIVVFFNNPRAFWPLKLNEYASTSFAGTRACLIVGPKGQNVDVVAHELMHAELFDRVGFWGRITQVPVWFDEGLAMQVDFRPKYILAGGATPKTKSVKTLDAARDFFVSDNDLLTWNYSAAKVEVAQWLAEVGNSSVYGRLSLIRAGASFNAVTRSN